MFEGTVPLPRILTNGFFVAFEPARTALSAALPFGGRGALAFFGSRYALLSFSSIFGEWHSSFLAALSSAEQGAPASAYSDDSASSAVSISSLTCRLLCSFASLAVTAPSCLDTAALVFALSSRFACT